MHPTHPTGHPSLLQLQAALAFLDAVPNLHLYQWAMPAEVFEESKTYARKKRLGHVALWEQICFGAKAEKFEQACPLSAAFLGKVCHDRAVMFDQLLSNGVFTEPLILHPVLGARVKQPNWIYLTMKWDRPIVLKLSQYYLTVASHALKRES